MGIKTIRKYRVVLLALAVIGLFWFFCLPRQLFKAPTSTVVTSSDNILIGARIADDGQWRFPKMDSVPHRFKKCVLLFEDEYFYEHPGVNPISIFHAIRHNLTKKTRRGGSTITQQVIRLSRKQKRRTYFEKLIEVFMATRLEFRFSKEDILKFYATHTPYGGNVVGLETASWRYFGIPAHELSWAQSAALAVLPNAPSLIFPGRNEGMLLQKRNRLLKKLLEKKVIDSITYELALAEPLPQKPLPLPDIAPHLTERIKKEHPGERITSAIDKNLQQQLNWIAGQHYQQLKNNEIHNLAIVILDVDSRKILGYVGNSPTTKAHGHYVDILTKKRSTGSTLKPFLFAALLQEGLILPDALVKDIPTVFNGYHPKNFNKRHSGVVPASMALSRSLNVPAVRLLQQYGLQKFYNKLKAIHMDLLDKPSSHYGLPLILGGAESSLLQVTQSYASLASTLNYFNQNSSTYRTKEYANASYLKSTALDFGVSQFETKNFTAGAIYHTFKSLREVNRPNGEENWQFFDASQPIAWKTGTSFGFKDAWAVGTTPKYAIGVWVGNADGEGRPGLTGITAAAPILFDVLNILPYSGWFETPYDDLVNLETCAKSGFRKSLFCEETITGVLPKNGTRSKTCPYHQQLALDSSEAFQVNADCYPLAEIRFKNWFNVPPMVEYYYKNSNPNYKKLPSFLSGCSSGLQDRMALLYPKKNEVVLLPKDLGDKKSEVIFKLAHQQHDSQVFWYLNDTYIGETTSFHELIVPIKPGTYQLTATDDKGYQIKQQLHIQMASID